MNIQKNGAVGTAPEGEVKLNYQGQGTTLVPIKKPAPDFNTSRFSGMEPLHTAVNNGGAVWRDYLITTEPEELPPLISKDNIPIATPGNHTQIFGKKKSRKTLFLVWLITQYKGDLSQVLWCDTEQGKRHVWKIRDKVKRLTGVDIHILSLRGLDHMERRRVIDQAIQEGDFKLVIIDGIRDLVTDVNDNKQVSDILTWIEKLIVSKNLHIVNVLHMNKTDNNPRGNLGTELLNKAEMTIELERDEKANCTLVKCESSRDIPFETFAFTHDLEGLPELVNTPTKSVIIPDTERKARLQFVFDDNNLKYNEVIEGIKVHFAIGTSGAGKLLGEFLRLKWIVKSGRDRSPDTVYKLMVSPVNVKE